MVALGLLAINGDGSTAQSTRSTPAIESLFNRALQAIQAERNLQATQLLTRLIGLPEHVHSERSQELLGNVREANGQLAHAVAEYRIYLEKYPNGAGAPRVSARLRSILGGAVPLEEQPEVSPEEDDRFAGARAPRDQVIAPRGPSSRSRSGRRTGPDGEDVADARGTRVTDRGNIRLVYRYNEGAIKIDNLDPAAEDPEEEDDVYRNAVTTSLRFQRIIDNPQHKVTLTFSGAGDVDFEDSDDNDLRLYDLSVEWEDKASGRVVTAGRQRLKPGGISYRMDGVSLRWPTASGFEYGVFAGKAVGSTRDNFLEDDRVLVGASITAEEGKVGPGEFTAYLVEQRDGSYVDRRALGVEYDLDFDKTSLFANAEVDLNFGELSRALLTGTRILPDNARITGRLSYYRSPRLSLQNALIGQDADTIEELEETFSLAEIEDLAVDRTSKVTTLGLTYYGPLNETWNLSAFGTLYHTSGTPASGGVDAVEAEGVRSYAGVRVIGSSVLRERDQVGFGLRYSNSDDSNLYVADADMRYPVTGSLTVRPRVRVGYRDNTGPGNEKFIIPSINARHNFDRRTSLQVEVGGRWSEETTATTRRRQNELFLTTGISRSF